MWNIVTSILSSVYEMERERILEITEQGRRQYVLNGGKVRAQRRAVKRKNRPFLLKPTTKSIMRLLNAGKSNRDIVE